MALLIASISLGNAYRDKGETQMNDVSTQSSLEAEMMKFPQSTKTVMYDFVGPTTTERVVHPSKPPFIPKWNMDVNSVKDKHWDHIMNALKLANGEENKTSRKDTISQDEKELKNTMADQYFASLSQDDNLSEKDTTGKVIWPDIFLESEDKIQTKYSDNDIKMKQWPDTNKKKTNKKNAIDENEMNESQSRILTKQWPDMITEASDDNYIVVEGPIKRIDDDVSIKTKRMRPWPNTKNAVKSRESKVIEVTAKPKDSTISTTTQPYEYTPDKNGMYINPWFHPHIQNDLKNWGHIKTNTIENSIDSSHLPVEHKLRSAVDNPIFRSEGFIPDQITSSNTNNKNKNLKKVKNSNIQYSFDQKPVRTQNNNDKRNANFRANLNQRTRNRLNQIKNARLRANTKNKIFLTPPPNQVTNVKLGNNIIKNTKFSNHAAHIKQNQLRPNQNIQQANQKLPVIKEVSVSSSSPSSSGQNLVNHGQQVHLHTVHSKQPLHQFLNPQQQQIQQLQQQQIQKLLRQQQIQQLQLQQIQQLQQQKIQQQQAIKTAPQQKPTQQQIGQQIEEQSEQQKDSQNEMQPFEQIQNQLQKHPQIQESQEEYLDQLEQQILSSSDDSFQLFNFPGFGPPKGEDVVFKQSKLRNHFFNRTFPGFESNFNFKAFPNLIRNKDTKENSSNIEQVLSSPIKSNLTQFNLNNIKTLNESSTQNEITRPPQSIFVRDTNQVSLATNFEEGLTGTFVNNDNDEKHFSTIGTNNNIILNNNNKGAISSSFTPINNLNNQITNHQVNTLISNSNSNNIGNSFITNGGFQTSNNEQLGNNDDVQTFAAQSQTLNNNNNFNANSQVFSTSFSSNNNEIQDPRSIVDNENNNFVISTFESPSSNVIINNGQSLPQSSPLITDHLKAPESLPIQQLNNINQFNNFEDGAIISGGVSVFDQTPIIPADFERPPPLVVNQPTPIVTQRDQGLLRSERQLGNSFLEQQIKEAQQIEFNKNKDKTNTFTQPQQPIQAQINQQNLHNSFGQTAVVNQFTNQESFSQNQDFSQVNNQIPFNNNNNNNNQFMPSIQLDDEQFHDIQSNNIQINQLNNFDPNNLDFNTNSPVHFGHESTQNFFNLPHSPELRQFNQVEFEPSTRPPRIPWPNLRSSSALVDDEENQILSGSPGSGNSGFSLPTSQDLLSLFNPPTFRPLNFERLNPFNLFRRPSVSKEDNMVSEITFVPTIVEPDTGNPLNRKKWPDTQNKFKDFTPNEQETTYDVQHLQPIYTYTENNVNNPTNKRQARYKLSTPLIRAPPNTRAINTDTINLPLHHKKPGSNFRKTKAIQPTGNGGLNEKDLHNIYSNIQSAVAGNHRAMTNGNVYVNNQKQYISGTSNFVDIKPSTDELNQSVPVLPNSYKNIAPTFRNTNQANINPVGSVQDANFGTPSLIKFTLDDVMRTSSDDRENENPTSRDPNILYSAIAIKNSNEKSLVKNTEIEVPKRPILDNYDTASFTPLQNTNDNSNVQQQRQAPEFSHHLIEIPIIAQDSPDKEVEKRNAKKTPEEIVISGNGKIEPDFLADINKLKSQLPPEILNNKENKFIIIDQNDYINANDNPLSILQNNFPIPNKNLEFDDQLSTTIVSYSKNEKNVKTPTFVENTKTNDFPQKTIRQHKFPKITLNQTKINSIVNGINQNQPQTVIHKSIPRFNFSSFQVTPKPATQITNNHFDQKSVDQLEATLKPNILTSQIKTKIQQWNPWNQRFKNNRPKFVRPTESSSTTPSTTDFATTQENKVKRGSSASFMSSSFMKTLPPVQRKKHYVTKIHDQGMEEPIVEESAAIEVIYNETSSNMEPYRKPVPKVINDISKEPQTPRPYRYQSSQRKPYKNFNRLNSFQPSNYYTRNNNETTTTSESDSTSVTNKKPENTKSTASNRRKQNLFQSNRFLRNQVNKNKLTTTTTALPDQVDAKNKSSTKNSSPESDAFPENVKINLKKIPSISLRRKVNNRKQNIRNKHTNKNPITKEADITKKDISDKSDDNLTTLPTTTTVNTPSKPFKIYNRRKLSYPQRNKAKTTMTTTQRPKPDEIRTNPINSTNRISELIEKPRKPIQGIKLQDQADVFNFQNWESSKVSEDSIELSINKNGKISSMDVIVPSESNNILTVISPPQLQKHQVKNTPSYSSINRQTVQV